jgi:hypothetical protein
MVTHRLGAGLVSVFVLAAACASAQKLPVFGTWKVTRFGADHCSSPKYTARTLSAAEFQQEYRVAAATLGISGEPITLYRLECGYDWGAKTNTLIVKSPTSLLTPLDGTFFELVKSPTNLK